MATLVARDVPPEDVFQNVTEEVCALLGLRTAVLHRFEDARTSTIVGKFGEPTGHFAAGNVIELEEGTALHVLQTGAPARSSYVGLPGKGAAELRALGFRAGVGVPISVAGTTWGALIVALREGESPAAETERRLRASPSSSRWRSRARRPATTWQRRACASSRRVMPSDGASSGTSTTEPSSGSSRCRSACAWRAPRSAVPGRGRGAPRGRVRASWRRRSRSCASSRAASIPPCSPTAGSTAALEVLAVRAPLPVTVETHLPERLPEPVEAAAYYVVSEALANVAKHAGAEAACVSVTRTTEGARIVVEDDGAGGADPDRGSGLSGLRDRVEALAGELAIESVPGQGTRLCADLPLR